MRVLACVRHTSASCVHLCARVCPPHCGRLCVPVCVGVCVCACVCPGRSTYVPTAQFPQLYPCACVSITLRPAACVCMSITLRRASCACACACPSRFGERRAPCSRVISSWSGPPGGCGSSWRAGLRARGGGAPRARGGPRGRGDPGGRSPECPKRSQGTPRGPSKMRHPSCQMQYVSCKILERPCPADH